MWTRLGLHAMDATDPHSPHIVHAFLPRDAKGYTIKETWDTLGMRATRSDDTILDGAFVPDRYIARRLPAGTADLFVLSIFGWAEPTFASIYLGLAERARDLAAASVKKRTSLAVTRSMAYHPEVQHCFSEIQLALEAAGARVDRVADDWANRVDHGMAWPMKLVAAKHNAVGAAKKVVDLAMAVSGGTGMFKSNELERLCRDVRCGGFTRPTRSWSTRSSARRSSGSVSASSRGGGDHHGAHGGPLDPRAARGGTPVPAGEPG